MKEISEAARPLRLQNEAEVSVVPLLAISLKGLVSTCVHDKNNFSQASPKLLVAGRHDGFDANQL